MLLVLQRRYLAVTYVPVAVELLFVLLLLLTFPSLLPTLLLMLVLLRRSFSHYC